MKGSNLLRTVVVVLIGCMMCAALSGCIDDNGYSGPHPELMFCAKRSIPGATSSLGDEVKILETDPYGRTLFAISIACSSQITNQNQFGHLFAVLIMQKSSDTHVYFYGEKNYLLAIPVGYSGENRIPPTEENIRQYFTEEEIAALKLANDWGKDPEKASVVSVKNKLQKEQDVLIGDQEDITKEALGNVFFDAFFRRDASGRTVYFVCEILGDFNYKWYLVAYDKEGNILNGEEGFFPLSGLDALSEETTQFFDQIQWQDITE